MNWQLIILIAVIAQAVSLIISKKVVTADDSDPIAFSILFQLYTGLVLLVMALIVGIDFAGFSSVWMFIGISVVFYAIGNILKFLVLRVTEASIYSIVAQTQTLWVILFASIFLKQGLTIYQLIGTFLIISGVVVTIERKGKFKLNKGTMLVLLMSFIFGIAFTSDAVVLKNVNAFTYAAIAFLIPGALTALAYPKSVVNVGSYLKGKNIMYLSAACFAISIGMIGVNLAYQNCKNVSQIAPLNQTTVIFVVILGVVLLKERTNLWKKALAVLLSFIGVLLLI